MLFISIFGYLAALAKIYHHEYNGEKRKEKINHNSEYIDVFSVQKIQCHWQSEFNFYSSAANSRPVRQLDLWSYICAQLATSSGHLVQIAHCVWGQYGPFTFLT